MKKLFLAATMLAATTTLAGAHDYVLGDLRIDHPYARASLGQAANSAAYMSIQDTGETGDRLVSAAAEVSKKIELHTHIDEDGVMKMRELKDGIQIPAGHTVSLEPGGLHIMLIGLETQLVEGESFPMTLTFEKAGEITVEVDVEGLGAETHDHGEMKHGEEHSN